MKAHERIGQEFGRWRIVGVGVRNWHHRFFLCECGCGCRHLVPFCNLVAGRTKQCRECMARSRRREPKKCERCGGRRSRRPGRFCWACYRLVLRRKREPRSEWTRLAKACGLTRQRVYQIRSQWGDEAARRRLLERANGRGRIAGV